MSKTENPDGQDDVDAIFGEIVADLRAEGVGTRAEVAERRDRKEPEAEPEPDSGITKPDTSSAQPDTGSAQPDSNWRAGEVGWDETMLSDSPADDDDEHFVPPEPPPIPKPSGSMVVVGVFFVVGLVLLIAPHFIGIGTTVATPLGLLSVAAGLGFLLLHARDDPRPPGADPQNGAQI